MYEVQRTRNAHVYPPESAWYTVSRHRSAMRAMNAYRKVSQNASVPGGWSYNVRMLEDGQPINPEILPGYWR